VDPDPAQGDDLGCGGGDQAGELAVEVLDLGVERAEALRELLHRVAGRGQRGVGFVVRTELGGDGDPGTNGGALELFTQGRWSGHG
jgi:hypothetical protein